MTYAKSAVTVFPAVTMTWRGLPKPRPVPGASKLCVRGVVDEGGAALTV
jgi:hypothetical protein